MKRTTRSQLCEGDRSWGRRLLKMLKACRHFGQGAIATCPKGEAAGGAAESEFLSADEQKPHKRPARWVEGAQLHENPIIQSRR